VIDPKTQEIIKSVRDAEMFHDGLSADLHQAGVTDMAGAYKMGYEHACDELAARLSEPAPLAPIYYMNDNHTFVRLDDNPIVAIAQIEGAFNAGFTSGMLCSKRPGFKIIHAHGSKERLKFFAEAFGYLTQIAQEREK
jgi:hypothetical protein